VTVQSASLQGLRVLVVEDDYVIALDLARALDELGALVVGPIATAMDAVQLLREHGAEVDAAILDVNLGSHTVYPVADALRERAVPFVFSTGYEQWSIPPAYSGVPRCSKPVDPAAVTRYLRPVCEG
jgi:CheY-like chemotaxis protein